MFQEEKKQISYGTWKSPITADLVAASSNAFSEPKIDSNGFVYFLELRPSERGRYALVRISPAGEIEEILPAEFNARNRVHEYGGASYAVTKDGSTIYFSNFSDQRIYKRNNDGRINPLTSGTQNFYADYVIDEKRNRLVCIQEDHSGPGEAINRIVSLSLKNLEISILVFGNDFYSSPRISPDGSKLVWLTWNHPELPFFGSELWICDISEDGSLSNKRLVAGSSEESIVEPSWSPSGILYFVSDRSNWWNIHGFVNNRVENVLPIEAEFSGAHWVFGQSSYTFLSNEEILCTFNKEGFSHLALIDTRAKSLLEIKNSYTDVRYVESNQDFAVIVGGASSKSSEVSTFSPRDSKISRLYPTNQTELIDPSFLSIPVPIEFQTDGNLTSHALYYAPKNADYSEQDNGLPPLIVISHGGPTGRCRSDLNFGIQFWTSRGVGVVDVNYGGSTGYGRDYRMRLHGNWGIVDVSDCVNAALFLVNNKMADAGKLIIRGGSAGGYTTLCALAFRKEFRAGASYYGISDLEVFAKDTHKFESRYLDSLVGPLPEKQDLYRARSALYSLENISAPVIFFQGLEDKIVPPNQAELMFDAIRKKGIPTAYISYEGEQHGFRQAKNIVRSYEAELYFYSKIFAFELPETIEPVKIENLST